MKTRILQFLVVIFLFPICAIANSDLRSQQIIELYAKLEGKNYSTVDAKSKIHDLAKVNYVKNAWNSDLTLEVYNQLLNGTDFNDQASLKSIFLYEMEQYDRLNPNAPIYKMDKKAFNGVLTDILYKIYPELNPANLSELDQRIDAQGGIRDEAVITPAQLKSRITEKSNALKAAGIDMSKYEAISLH